MQGRNDERPSEDQGRPQPAEVHPAGRHPERGEEYQDRPDQYQNRAESHSERLPGSAARYAVPSPPDAQRPNQGACRCPSAPGPTELRRLNCTCAWDEILTAVEQFAYGTDRGPTEAQLIDFAPVLATLVHDAAYRARAEALQRAFAAWEGTRTAFADAYGLDRSRTYQLGLHR